MKGSPGRKIRRSMEAAMIRASRPSIREAAKTQLANDARSYREKLEAATVAAALEAGRNEKVDPKLKEVREGPRALA